MSSSQKQPRKQGQPAPQSPDKSSEAKQGTSRNKLRWALLALLLVGGAGAAYYFWKMTIRILYPKLSNAPQIGEKAKFKALNCQPSTKIDTM